MEQWSGWCSQCGQFPAALSRIKFPVESKLSKPKASNRSFRDKMALPLMGPLTFQKACNQKGLLLTMFIQSELKVFYTICIPNITVLTSKSP